MPTYIHSDKGSSLLSSELRTFLHSNGVATSNTTPYNPEGNGQTERYNGVLWKSILLALKTRGLPVQCWEEVLPQALHANRSLLCTATNATPHERMFKHPRRTSLGNSLPSWLLTPGPVLIRNYYRTNKYQPLVNEVELIDANPNYAKIRYQDGREANVSIKDLAPAGCDTSTLPLNTDTNNDFITESFDTVTINEDTILAPDTDFNINNNHNVLPHDIPVVSSPVRDEFINESSQNVALEKPGTVVNKPLLILDKSLVESEVRRSPRPRKDVNYKD